MTAFFEFLWDTLKRGWKWIPPIPTAAFGILNYFDLLKDAPTVTRTVSGLSLLLFGALCGVLRGAYQREKATKSPDTSSLKVRVVEQGDRYYEGRIILILDKAPWLERGLILSLTTEGDSVTPVALLFVETFTSEDFPQCIVWRGYQPREELWGFLRDRSRWKSLQARRNVQVGHLENANHE